jgi:hypothetical protein
MASADQIAFVRQNIGTTDLTDEQIGPYIDQFGVNCAIGAIWLEKAAGYAELVDTSESGASLKLSDLRKSAIEMANYWCPGGVVDGGGGGAVAPVGVYIKQIIRDDTSV